MVFEKKFIKKVFFSNIFIIGIIISSSIMLFSNDIMELKIAAFFIFTFFSAASVKFDIYHPFVWFNIAFMLYSISGPLLLCMGTHPWRMFAGGIRPSALDYATTLNLQFIAILTFSIFLGTSVRSYQQVSYVKFKNLREGVNWVFLIGAVLSILHIGNNIACGFSDKAEAVLSGSPFAGFAVGFNIMNIAASVYLLKFFRYKEIKKAILFGLFYFSCLFLSFLLTGHRNVLYRFLLIFVMLYGISYKRLSVKYLVLIFVGTMLGAAILQNLKMALLKNTISFELYINILKKHPELYGPWYILYLKQVITTILGTEFMTASNNLALVIHYWPGTFPFLWGESFWWDIKRALVPGFLFNRIVMCTADFYNKTIHPNLYYLGQGPGFTLVGLPYINFGLIGIIPFFAFCGFVVKKIYKWSTKSVIGMLFYVNFMPVMILGIRYDLSAPISQAWKHLLLPLGVMLLISHVKRKVFKKYLK